MAKTKPDQGPRNGITWAQATRDVLVASISKGQFPWVIFGSIGLVAVFRMQPDAIAKLMTQIVEDFHTLHLLGWASTVIVLVLWAWHIRYTTRIYDAEIERLSDERTALQESMLPGQLSSSRGKSGGTK